MNQKVDSICTNYAAWHPAMTNSSLTAPDSILFVYSSFRFVPLMKASWRSGGINVKYPLLHLWQSKLLENLKSKEIIKIFVERLDMAAPYTKTLPCDIWYRQMTHFLWSFLDTLCTQSWSKGLIWNQLISWVLLTEGLRAKCFFFNWLWEKVT